MKWLLLSSVAAFLPSAIGAPPVTFDDLRELIRRGRFAEALPVSEQLLRTQPRDARVWTLKGIALQSLSRPADGLVAFRRALTIQPDFLPALQSTAQLEYQTGDPGARKTLERLIRLKPEPTASAMLGVLAFERRECGESVARFRESSTVIASQPLARWQFATCLFETEDYPAAAAEFAALLALKDDPQLRYNLGLSQFRAQRYAEAVATLEPLADADSLSLLASAHEAMGQTPDAVAVLRRALELFPRDERLYMDLAGICLEHHSVPLAVEIMQIGVRNLPESPRMRTVLGMAHVRAGQAEEAAEQYRRAAALAPDAGFGPVAEAMLLLQMGAAGEAVKLLRQQRSRSTGEKLDIALAQAILQSGAGEAELSEAEKLLAPLTASRDPRAHALRAKVLLQKNNFAAAAKALESALALDPDDRTATYQLMTAYRRLGRTAEAARLQARVRQLLDKEKQSEAEAGQYRLVAAPSGR